MLAAGLCAHVAELEMDELEMKVLMATQGGCLGTRACYLM